MQRGTSIPGRGGHPQASRHTRPRGPQVRHRDLAEYPPRTPRLNEKVERSHQTVDQEFDDFQRYATRAALQPAFARWLWHYNHTRVHTGAGIQGRTPLHGLRAFPTCAVKRLPCRCA